MSMVADPIIPKFYHTFSAFVNMFFIYLFISKRNFIKDESIPEDTRSNKRSQTYREQKRRETRKKTSKTQPQQKTQSTPTKPQKPL
jgi:hypothetical protein